MDLPRVFDRDPNSLVVYNKSSYFFFPSIWILYNKRISKLKQMVSHKIFLSPLVSLQPLRTTGDTKQPKQMSPYLCNMLLEMYTYACAFQFPNTFLYLIWNGSMSWILELYEKMEYLIRDDSWGVVTNVNSLQKTLKLEIGKSMK